MVWAWMLWVAVCSRNTIGILVWAWMLWSPYALGTRTGLGFGHGCSGQQRILSEHERESGLGMIALVPACSRNMNRIRVLGMDALVTVCSWNTNDGSGMDALVTVYSWNTSELWASAQGARALGAGGAKLLVSPLTTLYFIIPYIIPCITPFRGV